MSPNDSSDDLDAQRTLLDEYGALIDLGVESSKALDSLSRSLENARLSIYGSITGGYILLLSTFLSVARLSDIFDIIGGAGRKELDIGSVLILIATFLLAILASALLYLGFRRFNDLRHYRRELQTEREIHDRLMSLIDDQKRRVQRLRSISPVTMATLDIKVRRLDRTR